MQTESDDDPTNLTLDKFMATYRGFQQQVRAIKADDALDGLCICANCFGDRGLMAWRGWGTVFIRRRCLADPRLLTDPGDGSRRI